MAPEVIDLISDSDSDQSPRKAATSTLQAFGPRKEKITSSSNGARPQNVPSASAQDPSNIYAHPHAHPRPTAPSTALTATTRNKLSHDNASLAEISSRSTHSVTQNNEPSTPYQQHPAVPRHNGYLPRQPPSTAPQTTFASKPPEKRYRNWIEYQGPPAKRQSTGSAAPQSSHPRRRTGPLHEERQRRYEEYRRKEAERGAERGNGAHTTNGAMSSRGPPSSSGQPKAGSLAGLIAQSLKRPERISSPTATASQPEPKRRKQDHDEQHANDVDIGMRQARRLSAAAISHLPELNFSNQMPAPGLSDVRKRVAQLPVPAFNSSDGIVALHKANERISDDVAIDEVHNKLIDLTEDSQDFTVQPPPSNIGKDQNELAPAEVQVKLPAQSLSRSASPSDGDGSSPDEIPARAKPLQTSRGKRQKMPLRHESPSEKPTDASLGASVVKSLIEGHSPFNKALNTIKDPSDQLMETSEPQSEKEKHKEKTLKKRMRESRRAPNGAGRHVPYTLEEDDLLAFLKEIRKVSWDEMPNHFIGRSVGALQVRYSSKVRNREKSMTARPQGQTLRKSPSSAQTAVIPNPLRQEYSASTRRQPKTALRNDGFISWADIKAKRLQAEGDGAVEQFVTSLQTTPIQEPGQALDVAQPSTLSRLLRCREIGNISGRNWSSTTRAKVPDEMQNHILDTLGPRRLFHGASRDVTCLAWANDGNRFAAGAIAIDDERSMQYNRPNNLLLGDVEQNRLLELPEHNVPRPIVNDAQNVNSLHAMQESQDPRLFKTVAAVGFSEDSRALYSAGGDGMVRMYDTANGRCLSSYKQEGELALLTTNSKGLLASGCHRSDDGSISVVCCKNSRLEPVCQIGPSRKDVESSLPIYPSALKWGAGGYGHLLLAGFASDSNEEDRLTAGEVCLWDSTADHKIDLPTVRGVFDVAWNPTPSSGSTLFAVACTRPGKRYRSAIKCFAPNQGRASCVLEWDCPAFDINDVVYCPYDDNVIAAGATNGKVYIWDKRFAGRSPAPLHVFAHDQTKNVLDHDRDVEIADTGVRFLSWSATGSRLYSGSSDGTVKIWNPYRTTDDALVRNVATFNSAVMSGAFSPDYRDLLIGEDQGQLNLLGIDREERSVRAAKKFDLYPAPAPPKCNRDEKLAPARELLATQQIEIRAMGVLPVKQAVKGPNYQGPFIDPSKEEIETLRVEHDGLNEKRANVEDILFVSPDNEEAKKAFDSAQSCIEQIDDALDRLAKKHEDAKRLEPEAQRMQQKFSEERHAFKKEMLINAVKGCKLDCNYLPAAGDDDGEAPDNRRSEQRIPGRLQLGHSMKLYDTADMTNAEIAEAGLTSKCSSCMGPAAKPEKRGLPLCGRCTLTRSGLTARCQKCSAPVRAKLDERVQLNICERCNFHCFRCGHIADISGDTITCEACDVQWEAGVLGYEVKRTPKPMTGHVKKKKEEQDEHEQVMESLEQRMGRLFGDDERERLAGGWKVALLDGPTFD